MEMEKLQEQYSDSDTTDDGKAYCYCTSISLLNWLYDLCSVDDGPTDPPKFTSNPKTKELDVLSVVSKEATSMKEKLQEECLDLDTTDDGKDYYYCTSINSVYTPPPPNKIKNTLYNAKLQTAKIFFMSLV